MPWFFVDDAFADSKPVMQLHRALRNESVGLWVRCGAWSAKEETDGHVPLDTVKQLGGTPRLIKALHEQAELWVESTPESWRNSREILFGNWEKWQKTRAETQARRKREAEKKSTYRSGKKGRDYIPASGYSEMSTGDRPGDSDGDSECVSTGDSGGESLYPDPTRPDPTLSSLGTLSGEGTLADANDPEPPRFCADHPNDTPERCIPCKRARQAHEAWEKCGPERAAKVKEQQKKALDNCPRCEGTNTYTDAAGIDRLCRPHQEVS